MANFLLSDEHLVAVSERISTLGEGNRFPMQIEGDRITMKTFYDCLFTNDGHGDGRFTGSRLNDMAASTPIGDYLGVDPSRLSKIQVDALRLAKRYCGWYPGVPLQENSRELLRQVTFERLEILDKPSPSWETTDFDGKKHAIRDYRGKVVVLDFWNTACASCLRAMPQVKQVVEDFKDKPVTVLGMNDDDNEDDARSVIEKMDLF